MGKLTITEAERIALKHGITLLTPKKTEEELTMESRLIFKKDTQRQRDLEIREQALQGIMENRGISREEALKIMANPF